MAKLLYKEHDFEVRIEQQHSITSQDILFFHSNEFINRREESNPLFFNLYVANKNVASFSFEITKNVATSLPKSPFGGLIINKKISIAQIGKFLKIIIKYFGEEKYSLQIRLAPDCYVQNHDAYLNAGFRISHTDVNQHIPIDQTSFADKINRNRKRTLDSNISQGLIFIKLGISHLGEAYELITECRIDRGYPVTMTFATLENTFTRFPEKYLLFGVYNNSEMVATAVSIRVNEEILYNFYHGDRMSQRQNSAVTFLVAGIYDYCQHQKIKILDLGISSNHGELNEGLFYFKQSCGAVSSDKVTIKTEG